MTLDYQEPDICIIGEQYEEIGNMVYDQLRYNLAFVNPYEFIPEDIRDAFLLDLEIMKVQTQGKSKVDVLEVLATNGLSDIIISNANELMDYVEGELNAGETDISLLVAGIQTMIDAKKLDTAIPCLDKKVIISIYSAAKGTLGFLDEIYSPNISSDINQVEIRDCTFLQELACTFQSAVVISVIAGTVGLIGGLPGAITLGTAGFVGGLIAGVILAVQGDVIQLTTGPNGAPIISIEDCCAPELECSAVTSVSLQFIDGCNPTARYTAYGFGVDDTTLGWVNVNGTPPTAVTPVATPRLDITQVNTAGNVRTRITSTCSDGSTNTSNNFFRNLDEIVNDVYGVSFHGPDQIFPTETYYYYVFGNFANSNYTTEWFVNGGVINNSTNNSLQITWNAGLTNGSVQAQVTNNCSGNYELFTINVTGDGPIP